MAARSDEGSDLVSGAGLGDLLSRAAALLEREAQRLPGASWATPAAASGHAGGRPDYGSAGPELTDRPAPSMGALPADLTDRLQQQAHELLATLLAGLGHRPPADGRWSGRTCPVTKASVPAKLFDKDRVRQQAHAFIETLLITFNDATGENGLPREDKVPHVQALAPVAPGEQARAVLAVANEESEPASVSLTGSNFVSDDGHEIPAWRMSVRPARATVPPGGEARFEISIAVPQQTPAGTYAALIQALGAKYVKAVLTVEVT